VSEKTLTGDVVMHMRSSNKIMAAACIGLLLHGNFSFGQNSLPGEGRTDYRPPGAVAWSDDPQMRYQGDKATRHLSYIMYISELEGALLDATPQAIQRHANFLGLPPGELERFYTLLEEFISRSVDAGHAMLEEECRPLLAGQALTNEVAMLAIRRLDSARPRDEILENVLQNISNTFGEYVAQQLQSRTNDIGRSLQFTRVDAVRDIELNQAGDYLAYLQMQCSAL
jgi:hypothetical protein